MRISDWSSDVCSSDLRARRARNDGEAELDRGALRLDLVAHRADMFGLGSDEDHVMRFDDLGETFVFGQEAIARMDRDGAGDLGRRDDRGDAEIAVFRSEERRVGEEGISMCRTRWWVSE